MRPELKSARLLLKPYRASLVTPQHIGWLNDPEIVRFSEQRHVGHSEATERVYLNTFGEHDHIWLITVKPDNPLKDIGTITAYVDINNRIADMGILLGEKISWGKGYGAEAWQTVMNWLFHEQNIRKVECGTMMDNRAMRKIAVKSKMVLDGVRIQHYLLDGGAQDLLLYGKLRP